MRFRAKLAHKADAHGFHLLVREGDGRTAKPHQANDARNLQHAQAVAQCKVDENVTREKRQLQLHAAIFPPAHAVVERKKVFDGAVAQLSGYALLVIGAGADHIPARFEVISGQGRALLRTRRTNRGDCSHARHCDLLLFYRDRMQLRPVTHRAKSLINILLTTSYSQIAGYSASFANSLRRTSFTQTPCVTA